jgi:hypothetical protein
VRVGVLGTGTVGRTIGSKLVALGHEVRLGSRSTSNEAAASWASDAGQGASHGDFAGAAEFGELVFNCTAGGASLDALEQAGAASLAGKVLVDVANALDFSGGAFRLTVANDDSLAEQIQRAFPDARVVKTLNTVNAEVMVDPGLVPGDHVLFVSGDDHAAKHETTLLLEELGWPAARVIDLGGIETARGPECWMHLWLPLWKRLGTNRFNLTIARGDA